jgi:geranylgeranyl diphosphate synthase type II
MSNVTFELAPYLEERRGLINEALKRELARLPSDSRVKAAMDYSLNAGGKRVRPVLCLAAADAVGGDFHSALSMACAFEMIHTFSLIHDDLPAMDDDDMRRGRPTCHKAFDEATALLAGDALLSHAFEMACRKVPDIDPGRYLKVLHSMARSVGCFGMIEGQMRDLLGETHIVSLQELEAIHRLKTGAIIEASLFCGGTIGGGNEKQLAALEAFGRRIGLAFQVTDDILNVEGDPRILGKATGTDLARNKSTYPALMGLERAREFAGQLIQDALKALADFDNRSDPLRSIANYIVARRR